MARRKIYGDLSPGTDINGGGFHGGTRPLCTRPPHQNKNNPPTSEYPAFNFTGSDMGPETVFSELISAIENTFGVTPYDWQRDIFHQLLRGQDLLVSAGTSSGKSLLFQGMCLLFSQAYVLVISPLKALMEDQVTS